MVKERCDVGGGKRFINRRAMRLFVVTIVIVEKNVNMDLHKKDNMLDLFNALDRRLGNGGGDKQKRDREHTLTHCCLVSDTGRIRRSGRIRVEIHQLGDSLRRNRAGSSSKPTL